MIKYGKSATDILKFKESFFSNNDILRDGLLRLNEAYAAQIKRLNCKLCNFNLPEEADFAKHLVKYSVCTRCGHLNGIYEDSDSFCSLAYVDDNGAEYAKNYSSLQEADYHARVAAIYCPKAEFLLSALREAGEEAENLTYADMGAGAGYFVSALQRQSIRKVTGYEVSKAQISIAERFLGLGHVLPLSLNDEVAIAGTVSADVISLIGVLEHLRDPRGVLAALCSNPSTSYIFVSVPTFSMSVFIELAFRDVMPRHLSGGHTHLFTEQSIDWISQEYGLERVAEWWFGSDVMDLFRSVMVCLEVEGVSKAIKEKWVASILPSLDNMQLALDQKKLSSEVHLLFKIKRESNKRY